MTLFDLRLSLLRSRGSRVTVAVLLSWEPPREGDLPVHNYRVTWMPRHAHAVHKHTHTLHAHTHTVNSNMHTRPAQSRTPEQGKKESNSRVTQGVRKHFYKLPLQSRICVFLLFLLLNVWASLCRTMNVQTSTLKCCFHNQCWKCTFALCAICDIPNSLEANPGPTFSIDKCDVEMFSLMCSYTENGLNSAVGSLSRSKTFKWKNICIAII